MITPLLGVLLTCSGILAQEEIGSPPETVALSEESESGNQTERPVHDAQQRVLAALERVLANDGAETDRLEALLTLVASDDPLAIDVIRSTLIAELGIDDLLVRAVRESDPAPTHLIPLLEESLDDPRSGVRVLAIRSLARWSSREVTGTLIERMGRAPLLTADEQRLIALSLREMLGLPPGKGPATDAPRDWSLWWETNGALTESAWDQLLHERLRSLARDRALALDEATRTLREAYRRLYALLPEEQRSAFIAELLRAKRPGVRELGHDIATQALLNARTLGADVRAAALAGASDEDPAMRARSAALLERLGLGESEAGDIVEWLERENDGRVAASLLRLVAREPALQRARGVEPAIRWLDNGAETFEGALECTLALYYAGLLDTEQRDVLAEAGERALMQKTTALSVRVVGAVGDDALLLPLLTGGGELTIAAARALADEPAYLDALVNAARSDDRLFDIASGAMRSQGSGASSLATLLALPAPDAESKRTAAAALVASMPPHVQLEAIASATTPADRAAFLTHAGTVAFHADDDPDGCRASLTLELALARLAMREPQAALAALDALPEDRRMLPHASARTHALLWLGRLDEARALQETRGDVPASVWIDALRDAIELAHATALATQAADLYSETLNDAERIRLNALVARLAENAIQETPSPSVVDPTG